MARGLRFKPEEMIQRRVSTEHTLGQGLSELKSTWSLPLLRLLVYQSMKACQSRVIKIVVQFRCFH